MAKKTKTVSKRELHCDLADKRALSKFLAAVLPHAEGELGDAIAVELVAISKRMRKPSKNREDGGKELHLLPRSRSALVKATTRRFVAAAVKSRGFRKDLAPAIEGIHQRLSEKHGPRGKKAA